MVPNTAVLTTKFFSIGAWVLLLVLVFQQFSATALGADGAETPMVRPSERVAEQQIAQAVSLPTRRSPRSAEVPRRATLDRRGLTVRGRPRPELDALGARLGTFLIYPSLEVEEEFSDNIFATEDDEESDLITRIIPGLRVDSDWNNHALRLEASGDIGLYSDNNNEDYEDYHTGLAGRIDITRNTALFGSANYRQEHVARSSPEDVRGAEPTEFDVVSMRGRGYHSFGRFNVSLDATFSTFNFDDTPTSAPGVSINNDDQDRDEIVMTLRSGYEIVPRYEAFLRGGYIFRDYDSGVDDNGFDRDSDGFEIVAGIDVDFGGVTFGDFFAGYRYQDYDDSDLETVEGPIIGADITWNVTRLTTVVGSISRVIRETTTIDPNGNASSGRFFSTASVSVDHELLRNLLLGAKLSYSRDDFEGIDRTDDIYEFGIDATYMINRYFYISGGYSLLKRESDISNQGFDENTFLVRIRAQY